MIVVSPPAGRWGSLVRTSVALLLLAPVAHLAFLSLARDEASAGFAGILDGRHLSILLRTVFLATLATAVATTLGGGAALVLERRSFPCRALLRLLGLAPLLIPPVFHVAVWERLAAPGGLLATIFPGASEPARPFPFRNLGFAALILGIADSPIAFFFAGAGVRSVPRELVDAALLSRRPSSVFLRVVLPLAAPWIAAGAAIIFVLSFLSYEVPRLLDTNTYPVVLNVDFGALDDPGLAFAHALPAFLVAALVLLAVEGWADRRGFALTSRESPEELASDRRPGPIAWVALAAWLSVTMVLPLCVLAVLLGRPGVLILGLRTDGEKVLASALTALLSGIVSAALSAILLLPPRRAPRGCALILWIPLALPGVLLGFSLVRASRWGPLSPLSEGVGIIVVAQVLRFFPLALVALWTQLRRVPEEEWEAASLVPGSFARRVRLRLALAAPGLATGAAAVALLGAGELPATLLVAPPGAEPLIVRIYNLLHYDPERDLLAALCYLQVAAMLAACTLIALGGAALRRGSWPWRDVGLERQGEEREARD